jgi:hypothetical protein
MEQMNLHENLKWETILKRIEKRFPKNKFIIDQAYGSIYKFDQNSYVFLCKTFENTNLEKRAKRDFINNYQ